MIGQTNRFATNRFTMPGPLPTMTMIDLDALKATPLSLQPFDHVVVRGFVRPQALAAVGSDFPAIDHPGSLPVDSLRYGPRFARLVEQCGSPAVAGVLGTLFDTDLTGRPLLVTVRGVCRAREGRVHTDRKSKLVTMVVYLNASWEAEGGRMRLLRSPDIEDAAAEVMPADGLMVAFRNGPTAWHGHRPYAGPRRALQINWMTDEEAARREVRHRRASLWLKGLASFAMARRK